MIKVNMQKVKEVVSKSIEQPIHSLRREGNVIYIMDEYFRSFKLELEKGLCNLFFLYDDYEFSDCFYLEELQ